MNRFILAAITVFGFLLIYPLPSLAQERTAIKKDFQLPPSSEKTILFFKPKVKVGAQSTGGLFEPNADWTNKAKANLERSLTVYQERLGNKVIFAPEAYGDDAVNLEEHMALFAAVVDSVVQYQFFVGNRLPTKKRQNKEKIFEWSLGPSVKTLPGADKADYGLFIYNEDHYGSTGRKILQVFAALGPGLAVKSGEHIGYAGLVDLKTGDLLWLNADGQMGGDVRKPEGADKRARQLLEEFPGSDIGKE